MTISSGIHNTQCKPIITEINNSTLPKKPQGDLNVGLIASSGTLITLLVAAAILFIVASLVVVVCHKAGRVSRSTHGDTIEVNLAYGVTPILQDSHRPGVSSAEGVYDYPTPSIDINVTRLRMNEAYGVVYEIITAAGHGESTYRHPGVEFADDNIEAKQNETYAAIADVVMEENMVYNL